MLRELHIQNYAVIEDLGLEFHAGLNLLSGETGSGKSILVDALALALGDRASPEVIRTGADRASVTAIFGWDGQPGADGSGRSRRGDEARRPWREWFVEYGIEGGEGPEVTLRREIHSSGRSRLLVNDQAVTAAAVRTLARQLVEVHGQGEHVALFSRDAQLDLLDQFAGVEDAALAVASLFRRASELERELESLRQNEQERLRAIDVLTFQVQEIERARLEPSEDARLTGERRLLSNLERIRAAASGAFAQLYEDEGSACSRLRVVERALDELRRYDAAFGPYAEPLAQATATLGDLALYLRDYLGKLEANPGRLEEIEDRLALIDRLKRKYGQTLEEILAYGQKVRKQLSSLEHADERRSELDQELGKTAAEYNRAAQALSDKRRAAAGKLEKLICGELAQVGMEKTRFEVHRGSGAAGSRGLDEIELRISPNPGEETRPLDKIASGGELSRLMLALKTVVGVGRAGDAPRRTAPTFIFDEVDAGIGGRVAESVGQRLKRLARDTQVLCVTHLPQIACFADHHYYVEKFERTGRTFTAVTYLESQKERAAELARMLSGSQITDAVLKHAAAMLRQATALARDRHGAEEQNQNVT
jgi:DNA repair protein RecN (Recombination protein N)